MPIAKEASPLWAEGSKEKVHLGLGWEDMVFLFLALKIVNQAHLAVVTSIEHNWLLQGVPWAPGAGTRPLNTTRERARATFFTRQV